MRKLGTIIICFIAITLMANKCKKETTADADNKTMVSNAMKQLVLDQLYDIKWYHSREEDKGDGLLTYRESSYKFPPSRGGRVGFKLEKGGVYWDYGPNAADVPTETKGTWTLLENSNTIQVNLTKYEVEMSYQLEFISLENNILKLKKIN